MFEQSSENAKLAGSGRQSQNGRHLETPSVQNSPLELTSAAHVTEQEKRKRIHNWLGEQSTDILASQAALKFGANAFSHQNNAGIQPVSEMPSYTQLNGVSESPSATNYDLNGSMSLLTSQSKFVAVDDEDLIPGDYDASLSITKYEEYEMRPIKPLNSHLQLELYGNTAHSKQFDTPKPRPQPLKKNTGATSRHSVTVPSSNGKENSPKLKHPVKRQNNLNVHSSALLGKRESRVTNYSPLPRQKSQQHHQVQKEKSNRRILKKASSLPKSASSRKSEAAGNGRSVKAEDSDDDTVKPFQAKFTFAVDLRHVSAATKIQASWRGFSERTRNPRIIEIRHEMRARRTEQYINTLCHEVQVLKERQKSDKRLRDLQTEAIRFMWTQIRQLQLKNDMKNGQRKSSASPRKSSSQKLGCESSRSTARSEVDLETSMKSQPKAKADASWRDDVNASDVIAASTRAVSPPADSTIRESKLDKAVQETGDERKVVQPEPQEDEPRNQVQENSDLKRTVEQLQMQVLQLQDALLSFSDRLLVAEEDSITTKGLNEDCSTDFAQEKPKTPENTGLSDADDVTVQAILPSLQISCSDDEELPSHRDEVPSMSLQNILLILDSSLIEKELWSLCEQAVMSVKAKRSFHIKYISPETTFIRKDGLISFSGSDLAVDTMYAAPEVVKESKVTLKSLIFALAVTMWSAADFAMKEDQAPCLSSEFETLLVKMSHDEFEQRADIDEVVTLCEEYHSSAKYNSLEMCASLYAEACNIKNGKKRGMKGVNFGDVLVEDREKTRTCFRSNVVPQLNSPTFKLKPSSERQLPPRPIANRTPHEKIMEEIKEGVTLKKVPLPKLFTVRDLFEGDPDLVQRLNILPGQRRRNMKAMQLALRRRKPEDINSPPRAGIPTAPSALRTEIRRSEASPHAGDDSSCSVVLRWHPAHIYDKHGKDMAAESILGYRIYVNGQPKGMVTGVKCRALLDGLKQLCEYRIHVRAVSALGESDLSNTVIAYITQPNAATISRENSPNKSNNNCPTTIATKVTETSAQSPVNNSADIKEPSGDDVVDRVLRRYGIPKTKPALSSTFPNHSAKIAANFTFPIPDRKPSADMPMPSGQGDINTGSKVPLDNHKAESVTSRSSDDSITPRTKELLEQLKDDLLN